jgi:cysteine desulfurase / selenocysteine lyase
VGRRRIYLDNAATSWPKPEAVYQAVDHYQRELGAPAGRGVYREALQVDRLVQQARAALARLIDAPDPNRVIWTYSGTDSLTLALRGLLRPGDHVVTSVCDHNAVLRPLRYLEDQQQLHVTRVGCDPHGVIDPNDVLAAVRPDTRLVAVLHASNVTGALQPIEPIAAGLKEHDAFLVVDAAQTVGHVPLSVRQLGCDVLAAPGHKGLLGPTGTGFLYVAPGVERELQPIRLGGTGTHSESDQPPEDLPHRYEAGNLNVPGIYGLAAGISWLQERGLDALAAHERELTGRLLHDLSALDQVTVYGPQDPTRQVAVISFNIDPLDPQEVATLLDQVGQIQTRAGFHCAPRMHRALKTAELGGTVRVSCGPFTHSTDIDALIETIARVTVG